MQTTHRIVGDRMQKGTAMQSRLPTMGTIQTNVVTPSGTFPQRCADTHTRLTLESRKIH